MTDRERWTVYPLLFLSLGIAVKDKLPPKHVDVDEVRCGRLVVTDRQHRDHVVIGTTPDGGVVELRGERGAGTIALGYFDHLAALMFRDSRGAIRVPPLGWGTAGQKPPDQQAVPPQTPEPAQAEPEPTPE
jgi:hypothetical protein